MKRRLNILILSLIFCFLVSGVVMAEEPQFELDIGNTKLQPGVSTQLLLTIKNAKGAQKPDIKGLDNFEILSQGSTTQTQIVNFKTTHLKKYHYQIMPQQTGTFSLQGIVEYQGQEYQTNKLTVEVTKTETKAKQDRGRLFIETKLEKDKVYFGEQVVLHYNLFSRYNVQDYGFKQNLNFDNFISKKIKQNQLKAGYVRINGKKYVKYEVAKVILTPTKTGELEFPRFNFQVNISSGDFFNSMQDKYLQTARRKIEVASLPKKGQPVDFSGLVGQLNLKGDLTQKQINYGDSVSWKVTASGTCNLDNLNQLINGSNDDFEIYQSKKKSQEEVKNGQYYSEKNFEIIMVPQKGGTLKFPEIRIPYFNPQTESYEYATLEGTEIEVTGAPQKDNSSKPQKTVDNEQTTTQQQTLETVTIDQINVQADKTDDYYTLRIKKSYIKWSLVILTGLLLLVGMWLLIKKYWRQSDDELNKIYSKIQQVDSDNQLYNYLNQLIKTKYGVSLKADSRQKIEDNIANDKVRQKVIEVIDYIENKRYGSREQDLNLREAIDQIYRQLK